MLVNYITFTNKNSESVTLDHDGYFRLITGFNLSSLNAVINQSKSTRNGAAYQSTKLNTRDFDIDFFVYRNDNDQLWIEEKRHDLFKVFNPSKNPIRIDFMTKADKEYYMIAELTSTPFFAEGFDNDNWSWQKSLLQFVASDPFIYEKDESKTDIALWIGNLEFPLEIPVEGIEIGYRSHSLIANVENNGSEDTGMLVRFKALTSVTNPSLVNVNTYEQLKLDITMEGNDVIEVSTYNGYRKATLIRNNVNTSVFGRITLTSDWLQLRVGDNLFRYDADGNLGSLEVEIIHRNTLIGV